jgi:branched-chain amino acid aminotransferase
MEIIPFDKREGTIWYNGKLIPWQDAKIHVMTHGLHYASCVFEGERAYNGKIFKLEEHTARLCKSAEILGFNIPYSIDQLNQATRDVIKAQNVVDGYVRPFAWRGSELMTIGAAKTSIHVAIACWSWPNYYANRAKGIRLCFADYVRPSPDSAPTASKAAGLYMICTISKNIAQSKGFDEALMLDYRGLIAEATSANFFMVIDGELHTPIADCFLNGITRLTVIDIAKAKGIKVVERYIKPEELQHAQEAFLTGTAAEITPILSIDKYNYSIGPVTNTLIDEYKELVKRDLDVCIA